MPNQSQCCKQADRLRAAEALSFGKRMKGGSESCMVQASDTYWYVVKGIDNPQGRRCVINDFLATTLATELHLPVPKIRFIHLCEDFIAQNDLSYELGPNKYCLRKAGLHFGSRVPVDPTRAAVYDWWPTRLLTMVDNIHLAIGCWLFDVWTGNTDSAQAIVYRKRIKPHSQGTGFRLSKIDHGFCFQGRDWKFGDARKDFVPWQKGEWTKALDLHTFEPFLSSIKTLSLGRILELGAQVPHQWIPDESEWRQYRSVLRTLHSRAQNLTAIVMRCWPGQVGNIRCN